MAAVASAMRVLPDLPANAFLAVNVSAETLLRDELRDVVTAEHGPRMVLELTEHQPIEDYAPLLRALEPLRERGARIAVDDTGAGYASLRHILALRPDIIKLDISLVRDLNHDPARRALAASLVTFENADELAALTALGIRWGQGYYLGRPAPLATADERQTVTA
jgi:EAL domain-containing protein (putative c-di-GMP-specific phosphodiesterase class I)